ncbi:MAG: pilin [Candidatus Portnoybacteria bacterium]|nr:pilin [Candidatus Portnoybacteria bacterium]
MKKIKYLGIGLAMQLLPMIAFAQTPQIPSVGWTKGSVTNFLRQLLEWFGGILFFIGIFMILWAAFKYMTAGGDDTKIESAKKSLIYGLVGIGIAILAFGVWQLVGSFLGDGSSYFWM